MGEVIVPALQFGKEHQKMGSLSVDVTILSTT